MTKRRDRRPTIIDVAERAGVSKSTAARALAGSANITDETRERVLKAAAQAGYERNHLAVGMRSGRSGLLGLVIPDIANPFWADVARGAQDKAAETGSSLLVFSSDWDVEREARHLQALRRARVDGAIINPVADNFDDLDRFGLPFVLIGSSAERLPRPRASARTSPRPCGLGMDHLVSKGHPAPSLILGPKSRLARARFLRAVHEHCVERDIDPAILPSRTANTPSRAAARRCAGCWRATACGHVCGVRGQRHDGDRRHAWRCARRAALSRGRFHHRFRRHPVGAFAWPGLTTIDKPGARHGATGGRGPVRRNRSAARNTAGSICRADW